MKPDINTKDHYYSFISNSVSKLDIYNKSLNTSKKLLLNCYKDIKEKKDYILNEFNINLDDYIEWTKKEYNKEEKLYKIIRNLIKTCFDVNKRLILLQISKYCFFLSNCRKYKNMITFSNTCKNLKFREWERYINKYYNTVHKCVLEGYAYSYTNGIGDLIISRWASSKKPNKVLDFAETNKRKKELLKEGKKLYDEKEALWYKERNIKYDGVDYRVFKTNSHFYKIDIINSKLIPHSRKEFIKTVYLHKNYRNKDYKTIADDCKTKEDIYYSPMNINYKLICLLYKYPNDYLKFIRNEEQCIYKRGAHNSKNRQRFQS